MPTIRLVFPARVKVPRVKPTVLTSADLSRAYFPAWGVPYSLFLHGLAFLGLLYFPVTHGHAARSRPAERVTFIYLQKSNGIMYLPALGNTDQSRTLQADAPGSRLREPSMAASPRRTRGLIYPGPQPILSDLPDPTNRIQTVLQPALENPQILKPPLALPNLVQMASTGLIPQLEPAIPPVSSEEKPPASSPEVQPDVKPAVLPNVDLVPARADEPKLVLPDGVSQDTRIPEPKLPAAPPKVESQKTEAGATNPSEQSRERAGQQKIEPPSTIVEKPKEPPAQEPSHPPGHGTDPRDLLTLTPIPAQIDQPVQLSAGEARGLFAMSPEPNLDTTETEPGSKPDVSHATAGKGIQSASPRENGLAGDAVPADTSGKPASAGAVTGKSPAAMGVSTAPGPRGVSISGAGAGSASGTGPTPVRKPFAGITIIGGVGPASAAHAPPPRPLQTAYGVSIISTESSGGGLPFFGVFSNEQVYTVYLDMRRVEADPPVSWTLEFAALQGAAGQTDSADNPARGLEGLILPFPAFKELPVLPPELVRRYERRMVIVYAIINLEGKMEQISVKDTPDALLNQPVINALSKWVFRPARLNGEPVQMKLLMGIPLRPAE